MAGNQTQTSLAPAPAAPTMTGSKAGPKTKEEPSKKTSDIGKKPEAVSPLARMAETNEKILANQEKVLRSLDGIYVVLKDLNDIFHKKTGIFEVAAQQAKPKQLEKPPQQADDLPADLRDLSKEDREKLVSCPGGVKLKHFFPDKSVWTHLNFDILEPKGYKWKKDEQSSKNSHWQKGG